MSGAHEPLKPADLAKPQTREEAARSRASQEARSAACAARAARLTLRNWIARRELAAAMRDDEDAK